MAMESGVIRRWLKRPGDEVRKGEALLEIETDKVTMEVEAELAGVLLAALCPEGATVPVTQTIAWIGQPGEAVPAAAAAAPAAPAAAAEAAPAEPAPAAAPGGAPAPGAARPDGRVRATPSAKREARDRGLDLARVPASHPDGAVRLRDVLAARPLRLTPLARKLAAELQVDASALSGSGSGGKIFADDVRQAAASRPRRVPLTGMRKLIAARMLQSRREIPDATLMLSADITALLDCRAQLKLAGSSVTLNDLVLRATALALSEFPFLNATFEDETILCWPDVNLGVAVAVENGLVVPVLRAVQQTPLAELSALAKETVAQARAGKLPPDAYAGGTFTVTNLGMLGIEAFTPIINPPQTAILGVCAAQERPARVGGQLAWRQMMGLCLTHDHRVIDGALGAAFLGRLKQLLESPESLT